MKPFRLKNPSTPIRLVRLLPNQPLELITEKQVTLSSPFLHCRREGNHYWLESTGDILEYAHLTTHYLGEVIVGVDCKILVYLSGEVKKDTITIINPFNDSVRIRPFETIEFIYSSDHDKNLTWSWELQENIDIEQMEYKQSIAGNIPKVESKSNYFAHPRNLFRDGEVLHHFWFNLKGALPTMQKKSDKNLYIGRLSIEGSNEGADYDDCYVDVYCDLNPKWRSKTVDFLSRTFPVAQTTSLRAEKSLPKMMQVDFEPLETKCVYKGCKVVEIKVEA